MTRKHFELIARVVSQLSEPARYAAAVAFCDELAEQNPRFDRTRFLRACNAI